MKRALVTGATSGLGKALADALEGQEFTVIRHGRKEGDVAADVRDFTACQEMAQAVEQMHGGLDLLVCNAGITRDRTLAKMSEQEWGEVIATNLTGVFNTIRTHLHLIAEGGSILIVGSKAADGNFGQANYAAAKAGLRGLASSLSKELEKREISVRLVEPGLVRTRLLNPVPKEVLASLEERFGSVQEPEVVARNVLKSIK